MVDVRKVPRSRMNPQYNAEVMPASLAPFDIAYEHMPALGGLRARIADIPRETNAYWENGSFHNYADYAMTDAFRDALAQLVRRGEESRCAIMCAESVWWRCHRRIITDYLLAQGHDVFHIVGSDVPEPARLTPEAQPSAHGLVYPARQGGLGL